MNRGQKYTLFKFKVISIGNSGVGKTCILANLIGRPFSPEYITTMGIDYVDKLTHVKPTIKQGTDTQDINLDLTSEQAVRLQIWDTTGQERYRTIVQSYYRGTNAVLLVYDVTDRQSFVDVAEYWIKDIQRSLSNTLPIILIGNKSDLVDSREVSFEEGQKLAENIRKLHQDVVFGETSAKNSNSQGIQTLFSHLAQTLLDKQIQHIITCHKNSVLNKDGPNVVNIDDNNDDDDDDGIFKACLKFLFD